MCAVGKGADPHVIVDWRGRTFVSQDVNFRSWRAMHPMYERASFDVAGSSKISVVVRGAKNMIRNSRAHSRMWVATHSPSGANPLLGFPDEEFLTNANLPAHRGVGWLNVSMEWHLGSLRFPGRRTIM